MEEFLIKYMYIIPYICIALIVGLFIGIILIMKKSNKEKDEAFYKLIYLYLNKK